MSPLLLLLACGPNEGAGSRGGSAEEHTPTPGTALSYAPVGAMAEVYDTGVPAAPAPVTLLRVIVTDTTWEIDQDEVELASLPWSLGADGLTVGASHLLPTRTGEGETASGVTITAVGADTVWYGTFSDTVTAAVAAGELAGNDTFAVGLGPIRLAFGGTDWELVYYERPEG